MLANQQPLENQQLSQTTLFPLFHRWLGYLTEKLLGRHQTLTILRPETNKENFTIAVTTKINMPSITTIHESLPCKFLTHLKDQIII